MNFLSLIESKRDGAHLTELQIQAAVASFTRGEIPDYQMAAFLMAVYFRGLDTAETRALTIAMRDSGVILQFPEDRRPLADKHSTGGVGDKVSLPLAPLLACLGIRVPMISGRGLGITGGTLDKLESIAGFRTHLTPSEIVKQVQEIGCCICGQSADMTPADRVIYALRDVTGTVPSIPLITASILSKKLAENLDALILDVKFGVAAFMKTQDEARLLAHAMVELGNECGVQMRALITGMDTPLGLAAGNWLEIKESVEILENRGPDDLRELVLDCAAHLLVQTKLSDDLALARSQADNCLKSGAPRRKWDQMLEWQGADLESFIDKVKGPDKAPVIRELHATCAGYVSKCDAKTIGEVVRDIGGGRLTKASVINHEVGVDLLAKLGEAVRCGSILCRVHAAKESDAESALLRLSEAFTIAETAPPPVSLIVKTVE